MISLSNLTDERMRHAKTGAWWESNPEYALANNSVCYTEKPSSEIFLREWLSLVESKSGERGIINRRAFIDTIKGINQREFKRLAIGESYGESSLKLRRDPDHEFGVNPCCFTGDMRLLTSEGYKPFSELAKLDTVDIINHTGEITTGKVWSSGIKPIIELTFDDLSSKDIRCTLDHKFQLEDGSECEAKDLIGKQPKRYTDVYDATYPYPTVIRITLKEPEEVYDFTEPSTHWGVVEGCVVHNSEIILRDGQFCNLSECVIRYDDTKETIKEKVRVAAIFGTLQATMTDFVYLSPRWKENTEEEALLGVSMTGVLDNPFTANKSEELEQFLSDMRKYADEVNLEWAEKLGINRAAAITCNKPSGTVSALVDSASGIHPRYAKYYIRTVRADSKDPLAKMMEEAGFPVEPCVMKPDSTRVFGFPMMTMGEAVYRDDRNAIEQLELWLTYQRHWCDHKPSVTIYVKDHEWLEVGSWVYSHFNEISGVSFLPHSDHSYRQAPYQEVTEQEYLAAKAKMPLDVDWSLLPKYELEDRTAGSKTFACTGGVCELVDLTD